MSQPQPTPSPSIGLLPEHHREDLSPPEWPAGYKKQRTLGRGGYGEVFEAIRLASGERVAIKIVDADDETRRRHRREVRHQTRLDSPHVMKVLDSGEGWHAMPLAESSLWPRAGDLAEDECVDVLVHAARGLRTAHMAGLVHRDVSPGNILRADEQWLVSDFGLVSNPAGQTSSQHTSGVMGTTGFRAPEMDSIGAHAVDHRADIYSLGRVLRLLLGARPDASVPVAWKTIIDRMTAHNREERPKDLEEILAAELVLRTAIRASRKAKWIELQATSQAASGLRENAVRVLRWIYADDPACVRIEDLRMRVPGSPLQFNLGWQELQRRQFVSELQDQNGNTFAWQVTPLGRDWALEWASLLEEVGDKLEPRPPPLNDADAPF